LRECPRPVVIILAAWARISGSFAGSAGLRSDRKSRSSSKATRGSAVDSVSVVRSARPATVLVAPRARTAPMMIASPQTRRPRIPSRNSTSSGTAAVPDSRRRPARYPPSPKLTSEVSNSHRPPRRANAEEVSRQLDDGEATANPIADPKEISTNGGLPAMPQIGNLTEFRVIGSNGLSALDLFRVQLAALRFTPLRSATVESFLSAAFSSLRLVVSRRTISSLPSSSAQANNVLIVLDGLRGANNSSIQHI